MSMSVVERADLWCCEGTSDKVYHLQIVDTGTGFVVEFQYGRRGGHMNEGRKTPRPVSRGEAQKVFNKFVQEKTKKGYMPL